MYFKKQNILKLKSKLHLCSTDILEQLTHLAAFCTDLSKPCQQALFIQGRELTDSMYILSFIIQGLVTHNKFIQFQIFMKNYSNILKSNIEYSNIFGYTNFANRISEYIRKYLNYESNT